MSHILKAKRIMSKRKTIDAFFKKQDVSNSEIRTPVAAETNVNTSMPDEHPSKCPKLQFEEINRDSGSRKQICEFPIDKVVCLCVISVFVFGGSVGVFVCWVGLVGGCVCMLCVHILPKFQFWN